MRRLQWDRKRIVSLVILIVVVAAIIVGYVALRRSGRLEIFASKEAMREWVSGFGAWAPAAFFLVQMIQVIISPIPGSVTTLVGGALFGLWPAFGISTAAILAGSLLAFGLARAFGRPLVSRLVGPRITEKYLGAMTSRTRIALLLMFLLPFFPDDALSLIAGLTGISWMFFFVAILITRPWGLLFSSLVGSGFLTIPLWAWIPIGVASLAFVWAAIKWGPVIEQRLYRRIVRRDPIANADGPDRGT